MFPCNCKYFMDYTKKGENYPKQIRKEFLLKFHQKNSSKFLISAIGEQLYRIVKYLTTLYHFYQ
jgi:hypothetical protein